MKIKNKAFVYWLIFNMRTLLFLPVVCFLSLKTVAQPLLPDSLLSAEPTYISLQNAVANADKVYKLNLSRQDLDTLPKDLLLPMDERLNVYE